MKKRKTLLNSLYASMSREGKFNELPNVEGINGRVNPGSWPHFHAPAQQIKPAISNSTA
jgi:hypothetical protein